MPPHPKRYGYRLPCYLLFTGGFAAAVVCAGFGLIGAGGAGRARIWEVGRFKRPSDRVTKPSIASGFGVLSVISPPR